MPSITQINPHPRDPDRRELVVDGRRFCFVHINVVARLRLREGLELNDSQLAEITRTQHRQKCIDQGLSYLQTRLHSRKELQKKLLRRKFDPPVIEESLDELQRLGYLDDRRFAQTKALSAAQHKHHGRRRAFAELLKSGVSGSTAAQALDDVYRETDSMQIARTLALKQSARLKKLDPLVARRRLAGMLQRRGFDYETIRPLIDEVLGAPRDE